LKLLPIAKGMQMSPRSATVLVVDDERDTCANLRDILTDLDYDVDVAYDGPSALSLAQGKHYDVALLDVRMPGMDGLEVHRRLRNMQAATVAIVISAYASVDVACSAQQGGVWHVLPKPVDLARLLPLLNEAANQPLLLIVDDDRDLCNSLWDVFRECGTRVGLAHDIAEADRQLRRVEHHVVLIDLKLPSGDGSRVLRVARDTNPKARTIVITGHRSEMAEVIDRLTSEGADAVYYKPLDVPELIATVQRLTT
jgi:DNA-binding NtrC family response regulator